MPVSMTRNLPAAKAAGAHSGRGLLRGAVIGLGLAAAAAFSAGSALAQGSGSSVVELKPSQKTWTKVCGKDKKANKEICYTTRDFGQDDKRPPVLAVAVYDVKGDKTKVIRILMPVGLLLKPGFRFSVDKSATQSGTFEICFPNGCFAESKVNQATINRLKKGQKLHLYVRNQVAREVHFVVPLDGFAKSFDGPAIDPKVLQAQQEALRKQLEERAKKERERLEKAGGGDKPPAKK